MSRAPFKEAISQNLDSFYDNMNVNAMLRSDIHDTLMVIDDCNDLEDEQVRAVKYVLQHTLELYHICNRNSQEFKSMLTFFNPKSAE